MFAFAEDAIVANIMGTTPADLELTIPHLPTAKTPQMYLEFQFVLLLIVLCVFVCVVDFFPIILFMFGSVIGDFIFV